MKIIKFILSSNILKFISKLNLMVIRDKLINTKCFH